jgi:hypothetical protein
VYDATRIEDIKGFEFALRKGFNHYFSLRAAFNVEWLEGTHWVGDPEDNSNTYIFPDSSFIASGRYSKEWRLEGGRQVRVQLTDAEKREIGAVANANLADAFANPGKAFGYPKHRTTLPRPAWEEATNDEAREYLQGMWYQLFWFNSSGGLTRGRQSQGALQMFFSTPSDFGPGRKWLGDAKFLGGINANMIYKIYSGTRFTYPTVEGKTRWSRGTLHTEVDLSVQKQFRFGAVDANVFLEVFNLFAQKDANARGQDYMWWGLQQPRPDDENYVDYGDANDRSRYIGNPRTSHVGLRFSF